MKKLRKITTKDGSITYFNPRIGDIYHSTTGALEEAFEKYAKPCKVGSGMKILDICFGLGYNSLAAISLAKNIEIIALENDKDILKRISYISLKNKKLNNNYKIIKKAAKNHLYKDRNYKIKILLKDARKSIKELIKQKNKFDAVFLDPFSPKKAPELWTKPFFKDIKKVMKKKAILSTYSCAKEVRLNLKHAGFRVKNGPCIGRKAPSTIALQ